MLYTNNYKVLTTRQILLLITTTHYYYYYYYYYYVVWRSCVCGDTRYHAKHTWAGDYDAAIQVIL